MPHVHQTAALTQTVSNAVVASSGLRGARTAARAPVPVVSNQVAQHQLRAAGVQAKLTVNQPGDVHEREADRVAGQIMRMPAPEASGGHIQRACVGCGGKVDEDRVQRKCVNCQEEEASEDSCAGETYEGATIVEPVIGRSGHPLAERERAFFEPRFGKSFGHVRLHTDSTAVASAHALNALAYTKGSHIVFGAGQYAPATEGGRSLIAHELVHTIQQGAGGPTDSVQRTPCPRPPTKIGNTPPTPDCDPASGKVDGARILFCTDSDQIRDAAAGILPTIASVLNLQSAIEVHGFASPDGPKGKEAAYNLSLSCKRANTAADTLVANGVPRSKIRTFKHGGTTVLGSTEQNQSVVIPVAHFHMFRASAISMLACAPCNPFSDDGLDAVTPPASESAIRSFRQKHDMSAVLMSTDNVHIDPGSPGVTASHVLGISHYCGVAGTPFLVSRSAPSGLGTSVTSPVHGEGRQWESEMSSRVGVNVPCTLLDPLGRKPGAPCGDLGPNPLIPAISSKFRLRMFADGFAEAKFVPAGCTKFPFHYLYENGSLKTAGGSAVSPEVDFHTWSTSTGVAEDEALAGFKALRAACCSKYHSTGCPCECRHGETVISSFQPGELGPSDYYIACGLAGLRWLHSDCPDPCQPMGTDCSTRSRPANP